MLGWRVSARTRALLPLARPQDLLFPHKPFPFLELPFLNLHLHLHLQLLLPTIPHHPTTNLNGNACFLFPMLNHLFILYYCHFIKHMDDSLGFSPFVQWFIIWASTHFVDFDFLLGSWRIYLICIFFLGCFCIWYEFIWSFFFEIVLSSVFWDFRLFRRLRC